MSLIDIKTCRKQYPGVTLNYPDMTFGEHNTILVGKNGSGKSTLLYAIMGWVKYDGMINRKGTLAMMIERPMFPRDVTVQTVLDTLCPDLDNNLIKQFHLEEKLKDYISSLSKGMKAKLNLLQCIGIKKDVYLFDEPTSGLDKEAIHIFMTWLKTTDKRWIVSTHQPTLYRHLPCEVIVLDTTT